MSLSNDVRAHAHQRFVLARSPECRYESRSLYIGALRLALRNIDRQILIVDAVNA